MSQQKEMIPVESIAALSEMLETIQQSIAKAVADYRAAGIQETPIEGWKTMVRGVGYTVRIGKKITGPASRIASLDPGSLLLPHHETDIEAQDETVLDQVEQTIRKKRATRSRGKVERGSDLNRDDSKNGRPAGRGDD